MIKKVNDALFNTHVIPSDWRYSAAIVGLEKYLYNQNLEYEIKDEYFAFNQEDITRERFLEFAEEYYSLSFPHKRLEIQLRKDEFSQEEKKQINELLKSNAIMKKIFGKIKFDGDNKVEILECIRKNRLILIQETFRNKSDMYADFANPNLLFEEKRDCCRLWGYYIDGARKSKNLSFAFRTESFASEDCQLFDFIPFAFSGCREKFFINDNVDLNRLQKTNNQWTRTVKSQMEEAKQKNERVNTKRIFIDCLIEAKDFLQSDIEIIVKKPERAYFETLYLRKESLEILKNMKSYYKAFCFSIKISDDYWINILNEVFDAVVNFTLLDNLINKLLKDSREEGNSYVISKLLKVNVEIKKGDEKMKNTMKAAFACAKQIVDKKDGNKPRVSDTKLKSYCTKLINAIILDDYDQFQKILINLSNYAEVPCGFAYDLFEDFEGNKEIAYTFVNSLNRYKNNNQEGKDNE